jgi:hypothetical protein
LDEWRLVDMKLEPDAELDAAEWRATPIEKAVLVEKTVGTMESTTASGWQKMALERGGERGRWTVGHGPCLVPKFYYVKRRFQSH